MTLIYDAVNVKSDAKARQFRPTIQVVIALAVAATAAIAAAPRTNATAFDGKHGPPPPAAPYPDLQVLI